MSKFLFFLLLFVMYTNSLFASILTFTDSSSVSAKSSQSNKIIADYLKVKTFLNIIDQSVPYLLKSPELVNRTADEDEIKYLASIVARISMDSLNLSKKPKKNNKTITTGKMTLIVTIDTDAISRFLDKSLENNQFKAFAKLYYNDMNTMLNKLTEATKNNITILDEDVIRLFSIQRSRSYEMNQLAYNNFIQTSTKEEMDSSVYKSKAKKKETQISYILSDIGESEKILLEFIDQEIEKVYEMSESIINHIQAEGEKFIKNTPIFSLDSVTNIIEAKNYAIGLRKEISNVTQQYLDYTNPLFSKIQLAFDELELALKSHQLYDVEPIKSRWEASYQYQFRLNNYQKRLEKMQPMLINNSSRFIQLKTEITAQAKIAGYVELIKILTPYENALQNAQLTQWIGNVNEYAYIMDLGALDRVLGTIPLLVRYNSIEYIFQFDVNKFNTDQITYFLSNPSRFGAYPLFRMIPDGKTVYDIGQVLSGFLVNIRPDDISQTFLINDNVTFFPEIKYSDKFRELLSEEANILNLLLENKAIIDSNIDNKSIDEDVIDAPPTSLETEERILIISRVDNVKKKSTSN